MEETVNKTSEVIIAAASIKLPLFSRSEAKVWFRRAETPFRLKAITRSSTKADHVLASLPEDIFPRIAHWLNDQPGELSYDVLKVYLLQEFTVKPAPRAQKTLAMASQPLGDMTARQAWHEMQALLTLPVTSADSSVKPKKVDLEREIWLQRLSDGIRAAITDAEDMEMSHLIDCAEALIAVGKASAYPQRPMVSEVGDEDVNAVISSRTVRNWAQLAQRRPPEEALLPLTPAFATII